MQQHEIGVDKRTLNKIEQALYWKLNEIGCLQLIKVKDHMPLKCQICAKIWIHCHYQSGSQTAAQHYCWGYAVDSHFKFLKKGHGTKTHVMDPKKYHQHPQSRGIT